MRQEEERLKDGKFITMAFESSCDETSVAVLEEGRYVLSNVISSQKCIFFLKVPKHSSVRELSV